MATRRPESGPNAAGFAVRRRERTDHRAGSSTDSSCSRRDTVDHRHRRWARNRQKPIRSHVFSLSCRRNWCSNARIGLTAPTGKAAARLQESVREQTASLGLPEELAAMTLHRATRLAAGEFEPFQIQCDQQTSLRRGRRRRDVDGLPHLDGAPARGRSPRCPSAACRRS